jgi:hypothetical protein
MQKVGRTTAAEQALQRARQLLEELAEEGPDRPEYRDYLARVLERDSVLLRNQGRYREAVERMRRATELLDGLVAAHPGAAAPCRAGLFSRTTGPSY